MNEMIKYDSPQAAHRVTVNGWQSSRGTVYISDNAEHHARYDGSTHKICERCNKTIIPTRIYGVCDSCRWTLKIERYNKLPLVEWDGKYPLAIFGDDKYLWNIDDLWEYLEDINAKDGDGVMLVTCHPDNGPFVESDILFDEHQLDGGDDVDQEIEDAIERLNRVIKKHAPYSWMQSNQRVDCSRIVQTLLAEGLVKGGDA